MIKFISESGKEIEVESVEALIGKIVSKEIDDDTLIFSNNSKRWERASSSKEYIHAKSIIDSYHENETLTNQQASPKTVDSGVTLEADAKRHSTVNTLVDHEATPKTDPNQLTITNNSTTPALNRDLHIIVRENTFIYLIRTAAIMFLMGIILNPNKISSDFFFRITFTAIPIVCTLTLANEMAESFTRCLIKSTLYIFFITSLWMVAKPLVLLFTFLMSAYFGLSFSTIIYIEKHYLSKGKDFAAFALGVVLFLLFSTSAYFLLTLDFSKMQIKSISDRTRADLRTLSIAVETYNLDHNAYPVCTLTNEYKVDNGDPNVPSFVDDKKYPIHSLVAPTSYISDWFIDPFSPNPDKPLSFGYYSTNGGYIIISRGPNRVFDINWKAYTPNDLSCIYNLLEDTYDPSNGTLSRGDIWRWHQ